MVGGVTPTGHSAGAQHLRGRCAGDGDKQMGWTHFLCRGLPKVATACLPSKGGRPRGSFTSENGPPQVRLHAIRVAGRACLAHLECDSSSSNGLNDEIASPRQNHIVERTSHTVWASTDRAKATSESIDLVRCWRWCGRRERYCPSRSLKRSACRLESRRWSVTIAGENLGAVRGGPYSDRVVG